MSGQAWIDEVIRFWFEELEPRNWFAKDDRVDALIRERYEVHYERLRTLPVDAHTTPRACLAAVIVLDQFPRNMYRNSSRAFATDALALAISERAIERGFDRELTPQQRMFLSMPWQHAEDPAAQARSIELFTQIGEPNALDYARQHKEIIDRFGRFPHRNAVLGRASTAPEAEFVQTHRGF
jgi:uncharacterized protein (DUF924 family)